MTPLELSTYDAIDFARKHMCQAPGCLKLRKSVSYCGMHDMRFIRHGDVQKIVTGGRRSGELGSAGLRLLRVVGGEWIGTTELATRLWRTHGGAFKMANKLAALGLLEKGGGRGAGVRWRLPQ